MAEKRTNRYLKELDKTFNPFKKNPKRSKISSRNLTNLDIELLRRIVIAKYNEVLAVVKNERYYSKETIVEYNRIKSSLSRILNSMEMKAEIEPIDEIPKSW